MRLPFLPMASGRKPWWSRAAIRLFVGQDDERVRSLDLRERVADLFDLVLLSAPGDQVEDDLGVGRRLEDRPVLLELPAGCAGNSSGCRCGRWRCCRLVEDGERLDVRLVVCEPRRWNSGCGRWPRCPCSELGEHALPRCRRRSPGRNPCGRGTGVCPLPGRIPL